jgi:hypothetical protein
MVAEILPTPYCILLTHVLLKKGMFECRVAVIDPG